MKNLMLIILLIAFFISSILSDKFTVNFWKHNATKEERTYSAPQQVFLSLLGGFRRSIASILWLKSDTYHHDYLNKIGGAMQLSYTGESNYKITDDMPFYRIITWLDPNFINAYSVGGWYLMNSLGKFAEGKEFLEEGIRLNPKTITLRLDLARTYYFGKNDYAESLIYLSDAEKFLDTCNDPDYDKEFAAKDIYYLKSYAFLSLHDNINAVKYFQKYLDYAPASRKQKILDKIKEIEAIIGKERNNND